MPDEMWRQTQLRPADPTAWQSDPANACSACGRSTADGEFVWMWGTGRRPAAKNRGIYCLQCGPPAGEPKGADIASAVRRAGAAAQ